MSLFIKPSLDDGQDIVFPIQGKAINSFFYKEGKRKSYKNPKLNYPMLEIHPANPFPKFDFLQILYVYQPKEVEEDVFRPIKSGEFIGTAADLQRWYSPSIGPHVRVQMFKGKNRIDPTPFFFKPWHNL